MVMCSVEELIKTPKGGVLGEGYAWATHKADDSSGNACVTNKNGLNQQ